MSKYTFLAALLFTFVSITKAQTAADYAVQVVAEVQDAPAQIRLSWKPMSGDKKYLVHRKLKGATNWGAQRAEIAYPDTTYIDNSVAIDTAYEYRITKQGSNTAYGYIYAGIHVPPIHNRGALLLLVDDFFTDSCSKEIDRLMQDMRGDGWQVLRRDVPRTWKDTAVRALIHDVAQGQADLEAVLLLGHIAVPYSGDIFPDGHPDHRGAWPADVYYASNSPWTDASVQSTTASQQRHHNVRGDGKWDQSQLFTPVSLQISRIDFYDMPAFNKTEVQLMKSYLNRDHLYKMDSIAVVKRGLVDDNFGAFSGEAFAANAWRNFAPLVGREHIYAADFRTTLDTAFYQWALGCGGGSYTSASGIGSTADFAGTQVQAIFTMMFGSYFGDWDSKNNFLRAPLCAETPALTSCWAGRPHWAMHHMAMGEPIGYATRLTQSNNSTYTTGFAPMSIHIALMGDLTLRTDYIKPLTSLTVSAAGTHGATLSWSAAPDPLVTGYYVYRSDNMYGRYERISDLITGTTFADTVGTSGLKFFMVRPVKKIQTPSGVYDNLGIGVVDSATIAYPDPVAIEVVSSGATEVVLYPNPVYSELYLDVTLAGSGAGRVRLMDMQGRALQEQRLTLQAGAQTYTIPVAGLPAGTYLLQLTAGDQVFSRKFVKR